MKNKKLFLWMLYTAAVITLVYFLGSCTAAKDARAYNRVMNNPTLAEKAFRKGEETHPCITKPVEYRKGKDVIIIDTTYDENINELNDVIDSLLQVECPVTKTFNIDSLKNRIKRQVEKDCKPVHHYRIDTVLVEDTRRLQLTKEVLSKSAGANEVLKINVAAANDKASKWKLYFWIMVGLAVIFTWLRFKKII